MTRFYQRFLALNLIFTCFAAEIIGQNVPEMIYYRFNNSGGSSVPNEASAAVGNANAPIAGSGMSIGSTGQFGSALVGTGTSSSTDYVNTGWNLTLSGPWTISFYTSNITSSSTLYYIFGDATTAFRCFTNGVAGANNWMLRGTGIADVLVSGAATSAPHVVHFVYDPTAGNIKAYKDGTLVNTVSQSTISLSGGLFKVGAQSASTNLSGRMDEFRLYSHALSATEVAATWNQTLPLEIADFPYCQDFEATSANWIASGANNTWEWGEPNNSIINAAASGDNCWVTNLDGDHNNDELSFVQSPAIDLTSLVSPAIRFYQIRELQTSNDGVTMQVSSDSGSAWTTLGSTASPSPWFNASSVSALSSAFGNGNGWSGTNGSWLPMQHSLSSYANDSAVFIRFVMASNSSTVNEGFGFDDIIIAETNDVEITALIYPDSSCGTNNTTIRAEVCNKSVIPKSGFSVALDTGGAIVTANYTGTLAICSCDTIDLLTFNTSDGGTWNLSAEVNNSGDVNSANDTITGVMHIFASPRVTVSGGGQYCDGEIAEVEFEFTGVSPWNLTYFDGSNYTYNGNLTNNPHIISVLTGGTYVAAAITDGSGCPGDTANFIGSAEVVFNAAPDIDLGSDSSVCGDYVLDAGSGYTAYLWSTGATTQTIVPDQDGIYSVTATNGFGCDGSDEVDLEVFALPIVNLPDTVLCEGSTFLFNAGGGFASYAWSDGSTGQQVQVSAVGSWSVTVTNFDGCSASDQGSITAVVPNPIPTIQSVGGLSPVTLNAGSGYLAYLWNTNATTQTIQVSVAGTYTCTVTDLNGCKGSDDAKTKIWPTGIEDVLNADGFVVYPNPTSGILNIEFAESFDLPTELKIYNSLGQLVQTIGFDQHAQKQVVHLAEGLTMGQYVLKFSASGQERETTFMLAK